MFSKSKKELSIPPVAKSDPKSIELARIWVAEGQQHVTISADAWEDPFAWGIMLVDLARHVADYQTNYKGKNRNDVLNRIKSGFDAEWEHPTSDTTGNTMN